MGRGERGVRGMRTCDVCNIKFRKDDVVDQIRINSPIKERDSLYEDVCYRCSNAIKLFIDSIEKVKKIK